MTNQDQNRDGNTGPAQENTETALHDKFDHEAFVALQELGFPTYAEAQEAGYLIVGQDQGEDLDMVVYRQVKRVAIPKK